MVGRFTPPSTFLEYPFQAKRVGRVPLPSPGNNLALKTPYGHFRLFGVLILKGLFQGCNTLFFDLCLPFPVEPNSLPLALFFSFLRQFDAGIGYDKFHSLVGWLGTAPSTLAREAQTAAPLTDPHHFCPRQGFFPSRYG